MFRTLLLRAFMVFANLSFHGQNADKQVKYRVSVSSPPGIESISSLLQKPVTFARLLQFLRLKPYETCIFQRLLLQNWSFATASINRLVPKPGWFLHKSCGFSG
jgi:hypothetical protein